MQQRAHSQRVVDAIVGARDVQRDILEETLESARNGQIMESGRTICGSSEQVLPPIQRNHKSVILDLCPIGQSASIHTHVTRDQLQEPVLSIPDIAAVTHGNLAAIGVIGTQSAEFFFADEDLREQANSILGIDGLSQDDVSRAVRRGDVNFDVAHSELRAQLSQNFKIVTTGFPQLTDQVTDLFPPTILQHYDRHEAGVSTAPGTFDKLHDCGEKAELALEQTSVSITGPAIGAAIGTLVGSLTERLFLKDRG